MISDVIARLIKVEGNVYFKRLGMETFSEKAKPGSAIVNGDQINVGVKGYAAVIYIDDRSIIKIKENTKFSFMDSPNTRTIDLVYGTLLNKVNNEKRIKTLQGDVDMPLSKISTPSAILWGKHDPILKSDWGKFVEAHFDDVFVEYANNSGHFVHVEQPELAMKFINQNAQKWLI